jgi:hypothetical protein
MGFTLRSFLLSEGIAAFPRRGTRVPFLPSVIPPPKRWAGPTGRGFRVFTLPRVPGSRTGVSSPTAGCSLGFRPPRACWRAPCSGLHPGSSHALCRLTTRAIGRRLGVSIGTRFARSRRPANRTTGPGNPYRVLAPVRPRTFKRSVARAICSPHTAPCIAADRPVILGQ